MYMQQVCFHVLFKFLVRFRQGFFALDNPELYGYEIGSVTHRRVVEEVLKEAQLLSSLNHKNIVKMHGIVLDPATRYPKYVVMERAYCTLRKYLKDKGRISAVEIERLCAGVLSAMDYLHAPKPDSQQFAHRDIKDDNILVFYDKEGFTVKLCDMDHAKAAGSDGRVSRSGGAPFYLAPEATDAANATVDVKMDVFSFGILVAEIVLNFLPNSDGSPLVPVDVAHVYGTAGRSQMIEAALLKLLPFPTLSLLLRGCVTVDPLSRFTACDALALLADPRPVTFPSMIAPLLNSQFMTPACDGCVGFQRLGTGFRPYCRDRFRHNACMCGYVDS
jgi:serine/threonine protein kinase